jgi:membrane-bound ClpP family serine protease
MSLLQVQMLVAQAVLITLAADIAAMAPNTSIGAAHPVAVGGGMGETKA